MINLLPEERKRELEHAHIIRVVSLYILVITSILFVGIVLLFPIYIMTSSKQAVVQSELDSLRSFTKNSKEELDKIISDINSKLDVFADPTTKYYFSSDVVLPILSKANNGIKITSISYSLEGSKTNADGSLTGTQREIIVSGTAKDRPALLDFQNSMRTVSLFKGVNVPISNYVSGSNISFSIQFKIEKP